MTELAALSALDDADHRARAYRRAADTLGHYPGSIRRLWEQDGRAGLEQLPGIGPRIAELVSELLEQGRAEALETLRRRYPIDVQALLSVEGIGPQTLKSLWRGLRIRDRGQLETALRTGLVETLPGFGPRRSARLLRALELQGNRGHRLPRGRAERIARRLRQDLACHPLVVECAIAGSIRRGEATVGDIDLVAATTEPESVSAWLSERPDLVYVYSAGPTRVRARLREGIDLDFRAVAPEAFGSALLYLTGSRSHHLALRRLARAEGLRLNEYGLFEGSHRVAGTTESELYEALGLPFIPPEQRRGEFEIREALASTRATPVQGSPA